MQPSSASPTTAKLKHPDDALNSNAKVMALGDVLYAAYPAVPLGWLLHFGTLYALVHYALSSKTRRTLRGNIAALTGDEPASAAVRKLSWQALKTHHIRNLQLLLAPRVAPRIRELLPIDGLAHLDAAMAQGRGVILMGAHINSVVELMGVIVLRSLGYSVQTALPGEGARFTATKTRAVVNRLTKTPTFAELTGAMFVQFNVRPIVQALRAKQNVFMMGDGWHSASFVDVRFAGRTVPLTTGALSVAAISGAPVIPMFALGSAPDRLRIVLEPAFMVTSNSRDGDLAEKAQLFASRVERQVLHNVSAWQHNFVPDVFGTMHSWRERSLQDRYAIPE